MQRKEALSLIGERVSAWTAANGVYVGVLEEVTDRRPWRGRVRIDGVISPAVCYQDGRGFRRGFRIGELLEVGGTNIEPTDVLGHPDYLGLLRAEADSFQKDFDDFMAGRLGDVTDRVLAKNYGWKDRGAADIRAAIARIEDDERLVVEVARAFLAEDGWLQLQVTGNSDPVDAALRRLPRDVRWNWTSDPKGWRVRHDGDAFQRLEAVLREVGDDRVTVLADRVAAELLTVDACNRASTNGLSI